VNQHDFERIPFHLACSGGQTPAFGLGVARVWNRLDPYSPRHYWHRIEKLNELLPPQEQFDPALMRRQFWQFEKTFRAKFPNDKSLFLEIGCLVGGGLMEFTGLALLLPNIFK
jgi:hypothetical protein